MTATGLADGFFVHQEGNQLSTETSHLQIVNHELNAKILDLEGLLASFNSNLSLFLIFILYI